MVFELSTFVLNISYFDDSLKYVFITNPEIV